MLGFLRILVPYDFSDSSQHAARYACALAGRSHATVTLLHVLPPFFYEFAMAEPTGERLKLLNDQRATQARAALAELVLQLGGDGRLRYEVVSGEPAQEIIAHSTEYDAIVMSTLGAGALRRLLMIGSVTAKVLHAAECPVITSVHFESATPPPKVRKMLCAIDLGGQSARVLKWAHRAATELNAALTMAHVAAGFDAAHIAGATQWRAALAQQITHRLVDLAGSLEVTAEPRVEFGSPARALSSLAADHHADLVVLGRGESRDLIGRLRANAYDIIRQCPCPVVSV